MRLRQESGQCAGHAMCYAVAPELLPIDDEGYSAVETTDVDPGDIERVRLGVSACPERALVLEE
ncbi:ferredoxin [Nocardia zapadnayensis]|uniref:ferredoxin n=1 Tax=Nocardia rhamnosiphila TaxID=426716 RepID=UPI00224525BD|nr:ferredoxin [Nocardia zapadnayensis]MCX0272853.1 ferredoxin [Nocardia zapadnayensis]